MTSTLPNPLALIAELTHRCPLHCVYCSNPLEMQSRANELSTEVWSRVFKEAAEAGVLQADFTGGEPLARTDIVDLIRAARAAGLYVNLITSGLPLDEAKLAALVEAGLDHFQLSFQGAREDTANEISGTKSHAHKLRVLEWVKQHRIALTLNFVIHRRNIDQLEEMVALAESSSATRIEFANVQYYGWAFANRENLLPTRQQAERFRGVHETRSRNDCAGKIRVEFVVPDYYAKYPKPCMGGWGRKLMLITPERRRASLPRRASHSRIVIRKREGSQSARNLGALRGLPEIPRRRLDAGTLPHLRPPRTGFWRLPLPGAAAHGRCFRHRSRLFARASAPKSRRHSRTE